MGQKRNCSFLGSKERDNETGLDYFLARYYSSIQGRFTSPDEFQGGPREVFVLGSGSPTKQALPYADITNPQSLNKYVYTYNNPLRYIDPDGHMPDGDGLLDQIGKFIRVALASLGFKDPEVEDYDAQVIVNNRLPSGRKFGDEMKNEILPAMEQTGKNLQTIAELVDPTGGVAATVMGRLSGTRDNTDVAIAAVGSVLGGKLPAGVALSEAKQLVGGWTNASFKTVARSIKYHFAEHGADVGAKNVWQYLRQAANFNTRGTTRTALEGGLTRYTNKQGRYIIKDANGNIVSYGAN